ncbi:uncharacterized protein C11orf16 homolog [Rhincodon typus]|uniref:uncharacterized protein C11orf16 homolog n=1 Tax=Rhincodon typus TaxID=259920 RepID=UPI0009A3A33E|nr:uncharacterized protein C11orf16 homolog [Rhincodon typus]
MPVVYPFLQFRGFPTLFGDVRDTNVTFVIDTSESMQAHLSTVKYHLVETLLAMAYSTNCGRFNIVEFSNKVTKWCDRLVACSSQTIYNAIQWVQSLYCTQGRNLLGALTAAFHDPTCKAIYLVTNGLPDNPLKDVFHVVPYMSHGRPVHIFYLSDKWIDSECQDFLQRIGGLTQGSAHLIRLNNSGDIKQVIPIYATDLTTSGPLYSDLKYCTVKRTLDNNPYTGSWVTGCDLKAFETHPVHVCNPQVTTCICKCIHPWARPLASSQLILGASVLARRESDGFYYHGTIKQEVEVGKGLFLVEFDKSTKDPREKWQVSVQKTALHDIILYNEAMRHSVLSGDKVLAPWEPDETRYGPGTVAFGIETRDPLQVMEDDDLSIKFWNGKTVKVSKNVAMWIPSALYERVQKELLTPVSARQLHCEELSSCNDVCPYKPQTMLVHPNHFEPTYIKSGYSVLPDLDPYDNFCHGFYCGFHGLPSHSVCYCFPQMISPIGWWPVTPRSTKSTAIDIEELDKKITSQLQELDVSKPKNLDENILSSSSSSSSEGSDNSPVLIVSKPTLEDRAVNTDFKLLEKPRTQVEDRPEWKYWSQTHQEPHRKKPGTSSSSLLKNFSNSSQLNSSMELQNLGPTNCTAVFENVDCTHPLNRITMKQVLTHQDHEITSAARAQPPPIQERLGENQLSHDCQHEKAVQRSRKKKLQMRQWEREREEQNEDKYQHIQEQRRKKVIQRLENNFKQVAECEHKLEETNRAKQHLQQKIQTRIQSIASEDKEREARRLAYHQQVTARKNLSEAEKVKAEEMKEIQQQEARTKRVEDRNRIAAERFHEAEKLTEERETGRRKNQCVSSF